MNPCMTTKQTLIRFQQAVRPDIINCNLQFTGIVLFLAPAHQNPLNTPVHQTFHDPKPTQKQSITNTYLTFYILLLLFG